MVRLDDCAWMKRQRVRSIFLSDIHLGCRHSQARSLVQFLNRYESEYLYLVGDIIDGRSLNRKWCWLPEFSELLHLLFERARDGTCVRYTIGNHDEFLRQPNPLLDLLLNNDLDVQDEFRHVTQDDRTFLVLHGDRFDSVEQSAPWVSKVATVLYESLLTANSTWNQLSRTRPHRQFSLSSRIKRSVKSVVKYISDFEKRLIEHARQNSANGVICGHIHTPFISDWQGVHYCNTGDWVENCTALIEQFDGSMQLHYFDDLLHGSPCQAITARQTQLSSIFHSRQVT